MTRAVRHCPDDRSDSSGAIGFVANHHRAIAWGSPACVPDEATTSALIQNFLSYCESQHLQPVFACVDERVKRLLSKPPFAWHSLTSLRVRQAVTRQP